jgi:hypothetical protein
MHMMGVDMARRARRLRALAGAFYIAVIVYLIFWMAVVPFGLFGDQPIDYQIIGRIMLVAGVPMLVLLVPAWAVWVLLGHDVPRRPRAWWPLPVVATSLVLLFSVVALRGVVPPFAPGADRIGPACASLDAAGLDTHWPADTRDPRQDAVFDGELGPYSYCGWMLKTEIGVTSPYVSLMAQVALFDGNGIGSALGTAMNDFRDRDENASSPHRISGLGDEAFGEQSGTSVTVVARRANVVVSLTLDAREDSTIPTPTPPAAAARDMVRRMVAAIVVR